MGSATCCEPKTSRCTKACERLVDKGGLRHVFPWFMGKARSKGRGRDEEDGEEARPLSLIASLLQVRVVVHGASDDMDRTMLVS